MMKPKVKTDALKVTVSGVFWRDSPPAWARAVLDDLVRVGVSEESIREFVWHLTRYTLEPFFQNLRATKRKESETTSQALGGINP